MSGTLPLLAAITAVAALWDWETKRIPNELVLAGLLLGLAAALQAAGLLGLGHALLGAVVGLGALLVPWTRGWVGGGDVKLLAACGAFLGWQAVLVLLLAGPALHGLLTFGVLVAARIRSQPASGAPFAPALAIAFIILAAARPDLLTTI